MAHALHYTPRQHGAPPPPLSTQRTCARGMSSRTVPPSSTTGASNNARSCCFCSAVGQAPGKGQAHEAGSMREEGRRGRTLHALLAERSTHADSTGAWLPTLKADALGLHDVLALLGLQLSLYAWQAPRHGMNGAWRARRMGHDAQQTCAGRNCGRALLCHNTVKNLNPAHLEVLGSDISCARLPILPACIKGQSNRAHDGAARLLARRQQAADAAFIT